jgi:glycosyltransferase involved in cell wall biosynthesis
MRIAVVVNGPPGGALDARARGLTGPLQHRHRFELHHRTEHKVASVAILSQALLRSAYDVVWVLDLAYSGFAAALVARVGRRTPFVIDTGDAITALGRSLGRGPIALGATAALEWAGHHSASWLVVRGTEHRSLLAAHGLHRVEVVQDGVDPSLFRPVAADALRARLGAKGALTVGVVGSVVWNERHGIAYGWDLVELLGLVRDERVRGILVGDGDGLARLQERARRLGVESRIAWVGRVPYGALPEHICAMDICISTQSNDLVGRVRTTGKLPLYMACGRYVLASDVGEARLVLPDEMRLPYEGVRDERWPSRLAERVEAFLTDPDLLAHGAANRARAIATFDHDVLARRLELVLERAAAR